MAAEAKLEKYCGDRVKELGGEFLKVRWIGRRGCPDRLLWVPGIIGKVWVEFKAPKGRLSPQQLREHKRLRRMGECILVWRSREQVDGWLMTPFERLTWRSKEKNL